MGGKRKGGSVTVGYRYYWDIHSGLGRGPVDEIVEIRVDDKTAYAATAGELTHSQAIYIDKPNLFGGEETGGEGGIQGRLEILMGDADQKPTQALINLLSGVHNPALPSAVSGNNLAIITAGLNNRDDAYTDPTYFSAGALTAGDLPANSVIPGFRGIVTTVFSGLISCYNAHPKKHGYRVRRNLKGWSNDSVWYADKCRILLRNDNLQISGLTPEQKHNIREIHAMNPAHILVECATNKSWGGKKNFGDLDLDSYKQAADTLFAEGFGICLRYNRQESVKAFIQQVVDHIGAVQYDNVETGKQGLRLIRQDYDPATLPIYHYDNGILRVQDDDGAASDTAANQIIVKYHDPVANKEGQAIANNLAAIQMHGVISKTVEYKGIPTFDLAARVAQRDLEAAASGLARLKIVFDWRAGNIKSGDVFKVHLPDRDIDSVIFRVGKVENGNEGEIIVTCVQDVFGLPAANYSTRQTKSHYTPPDYSVHPITQARLLEVPYHVFPLVFSASELAYVRPTDCYVWAVAASPSPLSLSFAMLVDNGAGYINASAGSFTSFVTIKDAITPYQTEVGFDFSGNVRLGVGQPLMIDEEIVKIEAVDWQARKLTLGRGCADTVPQSHTKGSQMWNYLSGAALNDSVYTAGEHLAVKLLTKTAQATLDASQANILHITTGQRHARPYPPGNVRVNGELGTQISDKTAFTLSWAHRDRLLQADRLIAHTEDSTQLATGVQYEINLMRGSQIVRTITTTAAEFVYPDPQRPEQGENFNTVTLYAVQNGLKSLQGYQFS